MNLQTHVPAGLWGAIANSYESKNYSHAILDAFYHLSGLIRDRAGVDGDGASLVGQALGGEVPKLRINALQTESDKNFQKGVEQILRGFYTGIRNPRSHEQVEDSKEDADAILHFIGYIANILSVSKGTFTASGFLEKVKDPAFVESRRYAELIVAEIPALRLGEAIVSLFKSRKEINFMERRWLMVVLLTALSPSQKMGYLAVVSEEFRSVTEDYLVRTAFQMLLPGWWQELQELPRLRIENKIISGISDGDIAETGKWSDAQALSTWANNFIQHFTNKNGAAAALLERLSGSAAERSYVARFYFSYLPHILAAPSQVNLGIKYIIDAVKSGDESVRQPLISGIKKFPEAWQRGLAEGLLDQTNPSNPAVVFDDGTPFLSAPSNTGTVEDNTPF